MLSMLTDMAHSSSRKGQSQGQRSKRLREKLGPTLLVTEVYFLQVKRSL